MKPLTEDQKAKFLTEFNAIIAKAPYDIQKLWVGRIGWIADIPHFQENIHSKLTGELKDEYDKLKLRLDNRLL